MDYIREFDIRLEKEMYYAGEVLMGHVILDTVENFKLRGESQLSPAPPPPFPLRFSTLSPVALINRVDRVRGLTTHFPSFYTFHWRLERAEYQLSLHFFQALILITLSSPTFFPVLVNYQTFSPGQTN